MPRLWDISPPVAPGSPVFPGDTPFGLRWAARIGPGCPVNVSTLTLSPHTGAHADAPLHYEDGAQAIGDVALEPYLGRCRVVHAIGRGPLVRPVHLAHALAGLPPEALDALEAVRARLDALTPAEALDAVTASLDLPQRLRGWGEATARLANLEALRGLARAHEETCRQGGLPATATGLCAALAVDIALERVERA